MVVLRSKACYQRGPRAQYSGFKLDTSTVVLSIINDELYRQILQALCFDYI